MSESNTSKQPKDNWWNESWLSSDELFSIIGLTLCFIPEEKSGGLRPYDSVGIIPSSKTWEEIASATDEFYKRNDDEKIDSYNRWLLKRRELRKLQSQKAEVDKSGYVYLLKGGEYYKIGRTNDINRRVTEVGILLPFEVKLVCSIETDDMCYLETSLRKRFADKRVGGEWFKLDEDDVQSILELTRKDI